MATFEEAFQQGFQTQFNKTFKTPNELKAEEKALKLKDLDIQKKEIELNMQKTQHQHGLAVQEIANSGFDPNVVARVLSDRFPNGHQYKFDADTFKNSNGTEYRFLVGQYAKNEDGTYSRDPISGERQFTQYEDDGSIIGLKADTPEAAREQFMLETNRRVNPTAWMAADLEKLLDLVKTKNDIMAGTEIAQAKGEIESAEADKQRDFLGKQKEADRQNAVDVANIRADADKFQATLKDRNAKGGYTFQMPDGRQVDLDKKRSDALDEQKEAYASALGLGKEEVSPKDIFILDEFNSAPVMKEAVVRYQNGKLTKEQFVGILTGKGLLEPVANAFVDQMDKLADENKDGEGFVSSVIKLFK
jgi:hypothetical protein